MSSTFILMMDFFKGKFGLRVFSLCLKESEDTSTLETRNRHLQFNINISNTTSKI